MGIDRTGDVPDTNAETVEDKPDRTPPPPPDKPGTDGYPSRADSRKGAATANETSPQPTDKTREQKPEAPPPSRETSVEQASTATENKPGTYASSELSEDESSSKDDDLAGERKDTGHTQADTAGTSDPEQASGEAGDVGGSGGPESTPDGWTPLRDNGMAEMGKPSTPTDPGDQPQTSDKPQPDPPETARPVADTNPGEKPDTNHGSTSLEEKGEVGATEEPATTLTESTATSSQRLERRDDAAEGEDGSARSTGIVSEQDVGERLMVDGRPLRERLDPVGSAAWSNEVGDEQPDPTDRTGDRIANTEKDERPRAEKLRSKFHREGTDAVETAGKAASRVKDVLSRSPTGHSEIRTGSSLISAPNDGISVGDTATALIAAGVMFSEFGRLIHGKLVTRKGNNDGRHR